MKKLPYILCLVICLGACASTPYQRAKKASGMGYFDVPLQEGIYDVSFNGDADTSAKKAYDYALLRSAEVCLENGYQTFDIVSQLDTSTQAGYVVSNVVVVGTEPKINFVIHCSNDDTLTFRAQEIKTNLKAKYKLQ